MGIRCFGSANSSQEHTPTTPTAPNPNRFRFEVLKVKIGIRYVLAEVQYTDATAYGGKKLLLFRSVDYEKCILMGEMDPHFLPDAPTPLARFKPDEEGRRAADILWEHLESELDS